MAENLTNPLAEYEYLIQHDGISSLYESFLTDREMLGGNFTTEAKDAFTIPEQDQYGEWHFIEESFRNRVNAAFKNAYRSSIQAFSEQLSIIPTTEDLRSKANLYLGALYYLYQLIPDIKTYNTASTATKWVLKAIFFLHKKYPSLISHHPALDLLTDQPEDEAVGGFFEFKHTMKQLGNLFELLCQLNLFSKEDTTKEDFIEVFSSDIPESLGIKLKFSCSEEKAAWIIKQMQPLFYNLTDKALETSNCFQTNKDNDVIQGNFQTARSRYKSDLSKEEEKHTIAEALATFR